MSAVTRPRTMVARAVALTAMMALAVLAGCGSGDDGSGVETTDATDGGSTTATSAGEAATAGLPPDFVNAAFFASGDELVALAPRGAADPQTLQGSDDEGTEAPPLEIVAYRSTDAATWTEEGDVIGLDFSADSFVSGGAGDPDTLLLVGGEFVQASSDGPGRRTALALTSTDGLAWQSVDEDQLAAVKDLGAVTIDSDGSGFLAAGSSADAEPVLLATDDGESWTEVDATGLEVADGSETVNALAGTGDTYIAFGLTECDDCSDDGVAVAWTSTDGTDWAEADLGPLADALDEPNSDVVPFVVGTPTGFVAIVSASSSDVETTAWVSTDGADWSEAPLDLPGGAGFVSAAALGDEAVLLFAADDAPLIQRLDPST